jgi:SAM-dependent methyltransferase
MIDTRKLPKSFDAEFYRRDKPFVASAEAACQHFHDEGRAKGLAGSSGCNLGHLLGVLAQMEPQSVLEIGPGAAPRMRGDNVFYFDVKSRDDLLFRYRDDPDVKNLPQEIHFVDSDGDLRSIGRTFDVVFSSHVIEHTSDFVEHLNSVDDLLNPGGIYVVVAPNKDFCFDFFKPTTMVEDVLSRHFCPEGKSMHLMRSILLEVHRRAHNDPKRHWNGDHGAVTMNAKAISKAIADFRTIEANPVARSGYHNWHFNEDSFVALVDGLNALGIVKLALVAHYNTPAGGLSFTAVLARAD